ncbi:MAG: hypothetical protein AAGD25_15195 [Cyanobacteria bacterium P01_F01_bin.150]
MKHRQRLNKSLLALSSATMLAIAASQPAHAAVDISTDDVNGFISGIKSTIAQISGILNGDGIETFLNDKFAEVAPELQAVLDNTKSGEFPNPTELEDAIEQVDLSTLFPSIQTSVTEDESVVARKDAATEITSHMAIGVADESTFNEDAQEAMGDRIEGATKAIEANNQLAHDSQGQDVTQNIERNQSVQLAIIGEQLSNLVVEGQQDRVDRAMSNVMNAELLQEVQGGNLKARREESSLAAHSMQSGVRVSVFGRNQPLND